jgi:stress response protein SCP2
MSITLTKGERFNLSKEVPNFQKLAIALGWQVNQTVGRMKHLDIKHRVKDQRLLPRSFIPTPPKTWVASS